MSNQPILVTGAHRSGTTWVGKILSASGEAAYISEPLNVWHRPGVMRAPVKYWYHYINEQNEGEFLAAFQETLRFNYHHWLEFRSLRSRKDILRMGRDAWTFTLGILRRQRPLLKDPFAVFSAPWFYKRLGCQVVITLRHPAAFASSLKRQNWLFDFKDFLAQDLLMKDWLQPFKSDMEASLNSPDDVISQASLLWRMIYYVATQLNDMQPEFILVRHEDFSLDPLERFEALYQKLNLKFSSKAHQTILSSSSSENPGELSNKAIYATKLDSRANLQNWKKRLGALEIERIYQITQDVADRFYPDADWN